MNCGDMMIKISQKVIIAPELKSFRYEYNYYRVLLSPASPIV